MIVLVELSSYRWPLSVHSFDLIESYIIDINISLPMKSNKKLKRRKNTTRTKPRRKKKKERERENVILTEYINDKLRMKINTL